MKKNCIVCKEEVDIDLVREIFEDVFKQVDRYGAESLTEEKQHVYEGSVCSEYCYDNLD